MKKSFARYDTGLLSDKRTKAFISFSHAEADKWKGKGGAKRDHIDAGLNYDWDRFNYVHATVLYNEAMNNNINNLTLAEINKNGYYYDYADTFKGHLTPVKGTAQTETTQSPAYYKLGVNPFKNAIASATAKFRLTDNLDLKVLPYLWYGFGNGGVQQRAQSEKAFYNSATGARDGLVDLNGDGDTLDTVLVANASVTKTYRPGVTSSLLWTVDNHEILGGFWYERARHEQTGPMLALSNDGERADEYLQIGKILRPDGKFAQSRDQLTISTAYQFFLQDTVSFMEDKLKINVGVRNPQVKREFTNFGDENNSYKPYALTKKYNEILPQLGARYRLTNDDQFFASMAKNVKAPPNFAFANSGNIKVTNGVATFVGDVKQESSWNTDIGYRHQDSKFIATVTAFWVDFKDRQATAFDPVTQVSSYNNVGRVKNSGLEFELGNMPVNGWAFYGSLGFNNSKIQDNMQLGGNVFLPTAGKEMINTPRRKAGLSVEYQDGAFWARLKARATGKQQTSMVNDEQAPGYTTFGIDGGYTFANYGILKRPKLTFNLSNITDKQYRNASSTTVKNTLAIPGVTTAVDTQRYYLGAPRFASVTLSIDL
eukprot:gene12598-12388_t